MKQATGAFIKNRHWLFSKKIDLLGLFLPVWICWGICFALPKHALLQEFPLWAWVAIILLIDVSHVWTTLFKSYLDKDSRKNHSYILKVAPLLVLLCAFALATASELWFWRTLAYLALFHFIKQQYGFLALYKAKHKDWLPKKIFKDKWVIYFSMIYPVVFWHFNPNRNFSWFVDGDFFSAGLNHTFWPYTHLLYFAVLIAWLVEEYNTKKQQQQPIILGKIVWVLTTAFNWFLGIVYFNSDIAFSLTNVVAHGLPYIILIIFFTDRKDRVQGKSVSVTARLFKILSLVCILAFIEEYCWDMFVNRDKQDFFENLFAYPIAAFETPYLRALIIAILVVPQATHYILDAYIWKKNEKNPFLNLITKADAKA